MSRKHRRASSDDEVQLNMAAMLDMAFQLLAFFILTFRPPGVEWPIALRMPDAAPVAQQQGGVDAGNNFDDKEIIKSVQQLDVSLLPDANGNLGSIKVSQTVVVKDGEGNQEQKLANLSNHLTKELGSNANSFDRLVLMVGETTRYDVLMKVMDMCSRLKYMEKDKDNNLKLQPLTKLTFIELQYKPSAKK